MRTQQAGAAIRQRFGLCAGWRRGRVAASVLLWTLLSACIGTSPGGGTSPEGKILVFQKGDIRAAAPVGYCADPAASHDSGRGAVILIGRCPGASVVPALIPITVGPPGSSQALKPGAKALSDYFRSPAGRAALARDGRPGSVRILKTLLADGSLLMRIEDQKAGAYWRAVLGLKGRLVSVSVMPPAGGALSDEAGRALLSSTISAMQSAN